MMAIMLVSVQKGFWDADQQTVDQLTKEFGQAVVENGLPGSGHTAPEHPMLDWAKKRMPEELRQAFAKEVAKARGQKQPEGATVTTVSEIEAQAQSKPEQADKAESPQKPAEPQPEQPSASKEQPKEQRQAAPEKRKQSKQQKQSAESDQEAPEPPWSPYWLLLGLVAVLIGGGVWGGLRAR